MDFLITGAAAGLGEAMTARLADAGHRVVATDVSPTLDDRWADTDGVTPMRMDVTDSPTVAAVAARVDDLYGGLDGLVNNAGLAHVGSVVECGPDEYDPVMAVNVRGPYLVTHHCFGLLHRRRGRVVNIASEVARAPQAFGFYSVSKVAMEAWSDALRQELQLEGMKVISIRPGAHRTAIIEASASGFDSALERNPVFGRYIAGMRSMADKQFTKEHAPAEVAEAVHEALTAKRPKRYYAVNNSPLIKAVSLMPGVVRDGLIRLGVRG